VVNESGVKTRGDMERLKNVVLMRFSLVSR